MSPALDDLASQDDEVDYEWMATDHPGMVEPSPEAIERVRAIVMTLWASRAQERGLPVPVDLSSSCKFGSLLSKCLFGGRLAGNHGHLHVVSQGRIVDLSEGAADVAALVEPYRDDEAFLREPELHESMTSCVPRVREWLAVVAPSVIDRGPVP